MNFNSHVYKFVIVVTILYLVVSALLLSFKIKAGPFEKVNLLSDIVKEDSEQQDSSVSKNSSSKFKETKTNSSVYFDLYKTPHYITSFQRDTTLASLPMFLAKLYEQKKIKKRKIRIAYFGDSMIEGDLISQTFRDLMQKEYGGSGVGFVPVKSVSSGIRQTVESTTSGNWTEQNFKTANAGNLFLSGHLFKTNGGHIRFRNLVLTDTLLPLEKSILCGKSNSNTRFQFNNTDLTVNPAADFNRIILSKDLNQLIDLEISGCNGFPVYGVSFESETGVIVDNFSFRGITGVEYGKIDSAFLSQINRGNHYDLIIFQYGVNLLFKPSQTDFKWYGRMITPVINKLRSVFSDAEIVLVSAGDRAFRYGQEYKTAVGIDSLISVQADIALKTGCSFYNLYATMGGYNSIVNWANSNPPMANKDYVHPNHKGAVVLGEQLFSAIRCEYEKFSKAATLTK